MLDGIIKLIVGHRHGLQHTPCPGSRSATFMFAALTAMIFTQIGLAVDVAISALAKVGKAGRWARPSPKSRTLRTGRRVPSWSSHSECLVRRASGQDRPGKSC